jgi:hypothetical protein
VVEVAPRARLAGLLAVRHAIPKGLAANANWSIIGETPMVRPSLVPFSMARYTFAEPGFPAFPNDEEVRIHVRGASQQST